MNQNNNSRLTANAQKLRTNMTKEERRLWYDCLKKLPVTVNRQKVIGSFILDFYCASAKVAIELDGSQHYEEDGREKDKKRDTYLNERGITVLRYSNRDVNMQFRDVCEDIERHLIHNTSSVSPAGCHRSGSPLDSRAKRPLKGKARGVQAHL